MNFSKNFSFSRVSFTLKAKRKCSSQNPNPDTDQAQLEPDPKDPELTIPKPDLTPILTSSPKFKQESEFDSELEEIKHPVPVLGTVPTPLTSKEELPKSSQPNELWTATPNFEPEMSKIEKMMFSKPQSDLKVQMDQSTKKIDTLPTSAIDEIVRQFAKKSNTNEEAAVIGIAALCQCGGTNSSNPSLKRTINGVVFDLPVLREVVRFVTSNKGTVRQLAKSMRK